jgi:DNA replication protein DnaC
VRGASYYDTENDNDTLGDQTIADAICDRLVHNAHVLTLRGSSMRRQKGLKPQPETQPTV